ncbi:MAG: hypothetical protein ACYDFS_11295 [Vulcanimicrobiaceae bacterium]
MHPARAMLIADLAAIIVVLLWATFAARRTGESTGVLAAAAMKLAFTPPAVLRSALLMLLIGVPLTAFYLVALPAERFGALAWGALQFLTPGDAIAAVLIGVGVPVSIAMNVAARRAQATQTTLTFGGVIAALLPSSLCCTTLIPSALATLGASAPAVMHLSGRFQGFFAQYAAAFIGFAVAAVLLSLWLAASNLTAGCALSLVTTKDDR